MDLYPAIDILEGKAVRLRQGRFDDRRVYEDDPLAAAQRWVADGARRLHVVDLDGARAGRPAAIEHLRRICERAGAGVQYGGGLRSLEHVEQALAAGAERVVLGTAAFADEPLLRSAIERWGERIAVAVDGRGGKISTAGWTERSELTPADAVVAIRSKGVRTVIYTNVDRDGMLIGPDPAEVARASALVGDDRLIYSGGIGTLADLQALCDLKLPNLDGVIVGKALYEQRFGVAEAQRLLDGAEVARSS